MPGVTAMESFKAIHDEAVALYEQIVELATKEGWQPHGLDVPLAKLAQAKKHYRGAGHGPNSRWLTIAREARSTIARYKERLDRLDEDA